MRAFEVYASESGSVGGVVAVLVGSFVLYVAIAVGLGFAGRAIMKGKGRSAGAGFCLGFFLGVLGLLIAALQSDVRQQMWPYSNPSAPGQPWVGQPSPASYQPQSGFGSQAVGPYSAWNPAADRFSPIAAAAPVSYKLPSIFATITVVGYAAVSFVFGGRFKYLFGDDRTFTIVGLLVGVGLCVGALATGKPLLAGLAAGAALAMMGTGLAAVIGQSAGWHPDGNQFSAIPLDLLAIAGAVALANKPQRSVTDAWWKPAVIAIGGVGFAVLLLAVEPKEWEYLLAYALTLGLGLALSSVALLRANRAAGGLAAGFAAFVLYTQFGFDWQHIDYHGLTAFTGFFYAAVVATGVLGVMVIQKSGADDPHGAVETGRAASATGVQFGPPTLAVPAAQPYAQPVAVDVAPAAYSKAQPGQWAADPYGRHELRYFDGTRWTDHVSTNGVPGIDRAPC